METSKYSNTLSEIRNIYQEYAFKEIQEKYPATIDPYFFDWNKILTDVEKLIWEDIRRLCLPFYPKVPIGRYFVDFADPIKKIGIEVDDMKSNRDVIIDEKRESELHESGWILISIDRDLCFKSKEDFILRGVKYNKEDYTINFSKYLNYTSEGILLSLRNRYYPNLSPNSKYLEDRDYENCYHDQVLWRFDE